MQLVPLCALYPKLRIYNPFSFNVPFLASPPHLKTTPSLYFPEFSSLKKTEMTNTHLESSL